MGWTDGLLDRDTGSDSEGIDGGLAKREGAVPDGETPAATYMCTVDVEDIEVVVEAVTEHGGSVMRDIQPVPGVGWLAYCIDTEGNRFGVMERDDAAA